MEIEPLRTGTEAGSLELFLRGFQTDPKSNHTLVVQQALWLARRLQERATALQTAPEKRQQAELDRMRQTPSDKATLAQMTDQAFRTSDPHRAVEHLVHILDVQGVPRFFSPWDRTLMKGFQSFDSYLPGVAFPLVKDHLQKETANVILPGEKELLARHLRGSAGRRVWPGTRSLQACRQDNMRRYLPFENVRVRIQATDNAFEIFARVIAAHVAGCHVTVSTPPDLKSPAMLLLKQATGSRVGAIEFVEETDARLVEAIRTRQTDRVRYAAPDRVPVPILQAGAEAGGCVIARPVSGEGRLEMLWYLCEQSVSTDYHRYGNLGTQADEKRAEVL